MKEITFEEVPDVPPSHTISEALARVWNDPALFIKNWNYKGAVLSGVLRAPIGAAIRHREGWAVYALAGGTAKLVPVRLGSKSDLDVEIADGLAEHDVVVVHPGEKVKEGQKLVPR